MSSIARRRRWTKWLTRKPARIEYHRALRFEELEARLAPATFTWNGAGADNNWSTGANWIGGVAPSGNPAAGDELVFPAGAARLTNVDDIANGTFNAITVSGLGYTLNATAGNTMTLGQGGLSGSGTFVVNAGASANLAIDTILGAPGSSTQSFTVESGGTLTVASKLSGTTGTTLAKGGPGTMLLLNDNSGFTGPIRLLPAGGIMIVSHPLALGTTSNSTTVGTNATLRISNAAGMTINENVVLNGLGLSNSGALENFTGNNVWAGTITLDTNSVIGASGGVLSITGVISDTGAGHDLTKEGPGEVQFNSPSGNTYRGLTTINHGILTISHPLALGSAGTPANGTIVNEDLTRAGRLQINDPSGVGFTILNEQLTLNGDGQVGTSTNNDKGALRNAKGDNTWAGPVILGSPSPVVVDHANIGVAASTNLTISGVVSSPNQDYRLRKRETGRLIFNNANTYTGRTLIEQGIVTIRDSAGLGLTGGANDTVVSSGAALELEVEAGNPALLRFDDQGRDLWNDSVTGDAHRLWVSESLTISGSGIGNTGALRSITGINEYLVGITLSGTAAIGVDQDPRPGHPTPDQTYFINDYSLTTKGNISGGTLVKRNAGHLIFPRSNSYTGDTRIEQGWITIQDSNALGGRPSNLGDTVQPPTFVSNGAALHIRPLEPGDPPFTIPENITLEGVGPVHPYSFISEKGALMNLGGDNVYRGDIALIGSAGIGVEAVGFVDPDPSDGIIPTAPFPSSDLLVTGSIRDANTGSLGGILKFGSRRLTLRGDGTYGGESAVLEGSLLNQNDTGLGRSSSGTFATSESYAQTDTRVATGAVLQLDASDPVRNGGIVAGLQVWDERLLLNSPGQQIAVAGAVDPLVGRYRLSYDNGSTVTTTRELFITATPQQVQDAINQDLTNLPAGVSAVVTRSGNVYTVVFNHALGVARAPNVNLLQATAFSDGAEVRISGSNAQVVNLSHDNTWRGPVVLESHSRVFVSPDSRLNLLGVISDDPNDAGGDDFVKRGTGELALGGANTFRGVTGIDEGIVNVMNSSAFGATTGGTVVANGAQLQLQGNLTIAGEPLTIQGTGPGATPDYDERWLNLGAATTNNGTSGASLPTSGRITGVATDPSDPNVIYVAAAGGGVWKSKNGGLTWLQLFDETNDPQAALYGGSVYVAPTNPHVVYFATGEVNGRENGQPNTGQTDNYAGTGVYRSTDDGLTWTLLTNPDGSNPLFGQAITKLIVDPENANRIYVASGTSSVINANPVAVPGVYRFDGSNTWVNLTANPSPARLAIPGTVGPISAGPNDDFRITFPKSDATWSDILLIKRGPNNSPIPNASEWVLYAALGESNQSYYTGIAADQQAVLNAVYRTEDPDTMVNPTWWIGQGTIYPRAPSPLPPPTPPDARGTSFPVGPVTPPPPTTPPPGRNGWIKLAGAVTSYFVSPTTNASITVYASIARPDWDPLYGELLDIQKSGVDGGILTNWAATPSVPSLPFGQATARSAGNFNNNLIPALGRYSHTILVQDFDPRQNTLTDNNPNIVYFGGKDNLFRSTDGGTTWSVVPPDANGIYPSHGFHALHLDTSNRLLAGTDGGIWRMNTSSLAFQNLNANLSITQYNSVDPHPTDFRQAYGGAQDNGTQYFNNNQAWSRVDDVTGLNTGIVRFDPSSPNIAYAVRDGVLRKTIDGGQTWTAIRDVTDPAAFPGSGVVMSRNAFPLIVDHVNTNRILAGGNSIVESILGGTAGSFINLNAPIRAELIGNATFQGPFQPDPAFVNVTDLLSNTYDPDTIYVSDGTRLTVTKNHGVTWTPTNRTPIINDNLYTIEFDGFLRYKDVDTMTATGSPGVYTTVRNSTNGNAFNPELQSVEVVTHTGGTFDLRITYQGTTVTVPNLANNITQAALKTAIDAALAGFIGNEIQTVTVTPSGTATPRTFTLTFGGQTTAAIASNAAPSAVQSALEALTSIGVGNVLVTGSAGNYIVEFRGATLGNVDHPNMGSTGTNATVLVQETQKGGVAFVNVTKPLNNEVQDVLVSGSGSFTLSFLGVTTASITVGSTTGTVASRLADIGLNVSVTKLPLQSPGALDGYRIEFLGSLAGADQPMLLVGPSSAQVGITERQKGGIPGNGAAVFTDLVVDPSNRDTAYLTVRYGGGQTGPTVLRTTDAGQTWTDISGNLEGLQTWKIVIDPRDDSAYVGNDDGVFKLDDASTVVAGSITWRRFGDGMPHVQVKDLVLSQSLNTLTAATYGRGIQQLFLTDYESNAGALRVVSGSSVWTGPITLTGDTTIGVAGTQNIQNGIAAASLNIIGSISDDTPGGNHGLIKIGPGTATLSGTNTYGGQTQVLEGVLQVNNPNALGAATQSGNTVVLPTSIGGRPALAALELRSDLEAEPITINGQGFEFNDHSTGALRNVSNNNTYTGPLTFGTNTTIGVDSNTTLTIGELVGLDGEGTITDSPFGFDKESPGTLVLASGNQYDGLTRVVQGALRVEHEFALGDIGVGTEVLDGAQIQISRRLDVSGSTVTPVETVVTGEPLTLSGTGIFGTGALLNVRGDNDPTGTNNNKWQGPITFTIDPNFSPPTNPGSQIAVGVSDRRDVLTLDTVLRENNTPYLVQFGLIKVGPGVLALSQANQYTGVTNVNEGSLRVQHSSALGPPVSSEVQTINVFGVGNYRLQFTNSSGSTLTTASISASAPDALTAATTLRQRLEAILGVGNVLVSATANLNGFVFHVTFAGALANTNVLQLVATNVSSGLSVGITTPQQGGTGTIVANGASLETDGTLGPVTVSEVLTLNGDGVNGAGALNNVFGTNVYSGPITLATNTSLGAVGNSELIVTGVVQDTPNPNAPPVPAPRLRKAGAGVVTFPDAKPYGGLTDVAGGVLRIQDELALGTIRNEVQKIQVSATGGTLRLTFDGQQTGLMIYDPALKYTAPQIEAALEALPNIDDVTVTEASDGLGGELFTVTFLGNQGNRNVPQMTAAVSGATNAVITTFQNGQEGTVVRSGATLQIDGPLVMTSESVTINGPGFNNQGALNGFASDNIWATTLILGSDASIGTTSATDDLFFPLPITDRNPLTGLSQGFDLDVVGPGTVHFDAAGDNQYTGTTTVKQGTLLLNHSGGIAILGPLVVGDGGAIPALVRELQTNQVADTSPVTVNSNGTFDLNTLSDTIDKLTVNGGLVVTGAGGDLVTADVAMTGGKVTIGDGGTLNSKNVAMTGGLIEVGFGSKATVLDVDMKSGAAITLANTAELHGGKVTMDASQITGQDNVVVTIGDLGMTAGSGITLGNTAKLTAGAVTMESSALTFGTDAVAKVLDIGMTKGSAIAFGDRGNFQGGKLTMDASAFTAGRNAVLNLGAVTISGAGSLTVGDLGQVTTGDIAISGQSAMNVGANGQVTGGAVALDDGDITLGAFTTAKVNDIDMKAGSSLGVGNSGKLEAGDVVMAASDITIGDGGQLLGGDLTMDASTITGGTGTILAVGAVSMTAGSQVSVGGSSQVTAGALSLGNSQISVGDSSQVTGGAVSLDGSSITLGAGTTAKILGVDMKAASAINVGNGGKLEANGVTMAGSSLSVGSSGQLTTADVTLTGSTITLGFGSLSTVGNINQTGGSIDLGPVGTLTAQDVTVNGGTVSLGVSATANTKDVDLTGSAVNLASGSTLFLDGNATATSTATAGSFVNGPGTLNLKGITRTFAVNDGPQNDDLTVSALVVPGGAVDIVKTGAGRLAVTNTTIATGVDLLAGEMQVNGGASVGPVEIGGGTLSGTGTVGTIDGPGTGTAVNGIVSPGVSYLANPAGILTSGTAVWGPTTTFMVDLASSTPGSPAPGTDYDQLVVNGSIDVTGAKLVGLVGDGIELNDRYTIIRTVGGTVTGTFARPNGYNTDVIFVAGFKFDIDYSDPTKVDLVKVLATTTTTITTSVTPSTINQPVTFTATVTPEQGVIDTTPPGQPLVPLTSTVTFFIDGIGTATINVGADSKAVYTPTPPNPPLSGGSHTIVATYNGDPDLLDVSSSSPLTQVVEVPFIDDLAGSPAFISPNNSPGIQDQFTIATTVRSERSDETTWTIEIRDSLDNVVRTITGTGVIDAMTGNTFPINAVWDGKDDSGNFVPDGTYSIITTFVDEWDNTGTTPAISVVVDNTNPTADPLANEHRVIAPGTASTVFETTALTSTVADTNLTGWTVTIFDDLDNPVRTFAGTGSAVSFVWDGKDDGGMIVSDGEYTASLTVGDAAGNTTTTATVPVVVLTQGPSVTLTSNTPTVYGDDVNLTATVSVPFASVADLLDGDTIEFFLGTTSLGTGTLSLVGGQFKASLTVPFVLDAGTYSNLTASYIGTEDFLPSTSPQYTHEVKPAILRITADNKTKVYGDPIPALTFVATGFVAGDTQAEVLTGGLATPATPASGVGTYPILQGSLVSNGNYTIIFAPGTLTVTPANLTIQIDNLERPLFSPNPPLTATFLGLVAGDTPAVVSGLNLTTTATPQSALGTYPITASGTPTAANYTIQVIPGVLTVTPIPTSFAIGSGAGTPGRVNFYSPDGSLGLSLDPFGEFDGGVRVATGDFNRDGIEDLAVGTGPGVQARVIVLSGLDNSQLFSIFPFEDFSGGVFVAAGDITGDGVAELVITPDEGGGPRVTVRRGGDFAALVDYFGINDPNFRGGVRAGVGDINADGFGDVVLSAGFGGGPRISVWDGKFLSSVQFRNLMGDFFAFDSSLRNGAYVSVGDVNGDGFGDIIAGAGPGGAPHIKVFSGSDLLTFGPGSTQEFATFFAGDPGNRGGVRVAAKDLDGDGFIDLLTGPGDGNDVVTAYRGSSLAQGGSDILFTNDPFDGILNGVFVG